MVNAECSMHNGEMVVALSGAIDSSNAAAAEKEINRFLDGTVRTVIFDCEKLSDISSDGLRMILRLKNAVSDARLVSVSHGVYDRLNAAGFTGLMNVTKAYRMISVAGCEVIGSGSAGTVYRVDADTIVKVYAYPDSLGDIRRERELARTAFALGIPTAIPYEIVRVEGGFFGSVFELLDAKSFAELLRTGEKSTDEVALMCAELMRRMHSTEAKPELLPDMKRTVLGWVDCAEDFVGKPLTDKLRALVSAVPSDNRLIHGDFHIKNIMYQNGEALLVDMDTLSRGNPIFELGCLDAAYCGYSEADPGDTVRFFGIEHGTALRLWDGILRRYLNGADEETVKKAGEKARIIASLRVLRHVKLHRSGPDGGGRALAALCAAHLGELVPVTDSLII